MSKSAASFLSRASDIADSIDGKPVEITDIPLLNILAAIHLDLQAIAIILAGGEIEGQFLDDMEPAFDNRVDSTTP